MKKIWEGLKFIYKLLLTGIRNLMFKLSGKDNTKIPILNRDIPYMNKPIEAANADEIGMNVYVDYLESAIEKGADMIAVVSGFGTGKSSLIELLKEKYHGWINRHGKRSERVYCQVNLWSQLEEHKKLLHDTGDENESEYIFNQTLELHRSFLYQLIGSVYPNKSSYFSRRTGRNFGMFKITAQSPFWSGLISVVVLILALTVSLQYFTDDIVAIGFLSEAKISTFVLFGYLFCAISVVLLIVRTEIIFSSASSEGNRQIEENELIDLYREHILIPKDWIRSVIAYFFGTKQIVVVIEDLDRTADGLSVYNFLKELRKYYIPNDQVEKYFFNQVTFIVNIMPEDNLRKLCESGKLDDNYVYDKVFDYSINLNRIHVDNFDAVLEALILEKRAELNKIGIEVSNNDNVHKIPGMQWIIYGKELSLRQVKERLNDSIVVFESIKEKFGEDKPEFKKCAVVACLRSAFSSEFYNLTDSDLDEMLTWYAKEHPSEDVFIDKYKGENDVDFYEILYRMIDSRLIDENYKTYFFNYPKKSHLYNIQQTRVRNLIVYNETVTEDMRGDIAQVAMERPDVIVSAMKKYIDLVEELPTCIIYSPDLWKIAVDEFSLMLKSLVFKVFSNVKELTPEHYAMLDNLVKRENAASILCDAVMNNETDIIVAVRTHLLNKYPECIHKYSDFFALMSAPINVEEMKKMKDVSLEYVLAMVKGIVEGLESDVIDMLNDRILVETNMQIVESAEMFYVELCEVYDVADILDKITHYMRKRQHLIPELVDKFYQAVVLGEVDAELYFDLLNSMPLTEIQGNQMKRIMLLDKPGLISEEICGRLLEEGYTKTYLLNMIELNLQNICLDGEEIKRIFETYGAEIWEKHADIFRKIRIWACSKLKDDVTELSSYFKAPYPLITSGEIRYITLSESVFELYEAKRADVDKGDAFVEFCNRQYRKSGIAFAMFQFIAMMTEEMVPIVFYKLDMQKVRFSKMSMSKKLNIVEVLRIPLELNVAEKIVHFMEFTETLIPDLENELLPDLKKPGNDDLCKAYIKAIQTCGVVTKEAIRNIRSMPKIYVYGEMINQELYKRKYYTYYICSKNQEDKKLVIEYDKMDVLWEVYLQIFKSSKAYEYTRRCMRESKEFLRLVQNRKAYGGLPEDSRMAMSSILQDENTLLDVLGYSDEFVIEYFSKLEGFSSKKAAETFVDIMEKNQKYAQYKTIYENVYSKLENAQLKSKYTRLYNRANE